MPKDLFSKTLSELGVQGGTIDEMPHTTIFFDFQASSNPLEKDPLLLAEPTLKSMEQASKLNFDLTHLWKEIDEQQSENVENKDSDSIDISPKN